MSKPLRCLLFGHQIMWELYNLPDAGEGIWLYCYRCRSDWEFPISLSYRISDRSVRGNIRREKKDAKLQ